MTLCDTLRRLYEAVNNAAVWDRYGYYYSTAYLEISFICMKIHTLLALQLWFSGIEESSSNRGT